MTLNMGETHETVTNKYINACYHEAIQSLKPQLTATDLVRMETGELKLASEIPNTDTIRETLIWLPTLDQLLSLLRRQVITVDEPTLRQCKEGWECIVTISEWAEDYGTFIDAQRRFIEREAKLVVMRALQAALGIGERWMA